MPSCFRVLYGDITAASGMTLLRKMYRAMTDLRAVVQLKLDQA